MDTFYFKSAPSEPVRAGKITIITVTTEDGSELSVTGPVSLNDIAIRDASAGMAHTLNETDFKNQPIGIVGQPYRLLTYSRLHQAENSCSGGL